MPCPLLLLSGAGCLFLAGAVAAVTHVDEAACAVAERDQEIDLEIERERQRQRQRKAEMAAEIERERDRMRGMQRAKAERQVRAACVPACGVEVARAAGCFTLAYPSPRLAGALPALACLPSQPPTQPCRALPCPTCPAAVSTSCTTIEGGMRRGGSRAGASGGIACWAGARAHRDRGGRCPRGSPLPPAPCSLLGDSRLAHLGTPTRLPQAAHRVPAAPAAARQFGVLCAAAPSVHEAAWMG